MVLASSFHRPVLFDEVIEGLKVTKGGKYIDATLGGGGYTFEILERGGVVLGIDADREAIEYVKRKFQISNFKFQINKDIFLAQGNFAHLKEIAKKFSFKKVAGIVFDLGMSSFQLEKSGRGFSFAKDEPLDMRMDRRQRLTAAEVINFASKEGLYEIFSKFSEELHSRAIADAIFRARTLKEPITRTRQLVDIVKEVIDKKQKRRGGGFDKRFYQKSCARIFQALRIVVNNEIENLKKGLSSSFDLLRIDGRVAVLSYHSLEDRIVKLKFKEGEKRGVLRIITKQPIRASHEQICANFKARSVRLRIAEKIYG